ncbi:hypothetical protein [Psychroserpens ponticola]|uniref:Lipocalin-like domain-containing protein n=1 Tax=Psychroserpens ponticola TaxID=2932268 RepID=A0ABY7RUJ3_9FLAO|nr:hypothetical protein [Psychroserpens ponticola]WCO00335.1 hypothetical protein MUN68_009650 [Psychroserpens ponticola]
MKVIFKLFLALFLFNMSSCSSDDSKDDGKVGDVVTIEGVWKLTALAVESSFDFNNDGVYSRNLFEETPCYLDDFINFRADGSVNIVSALTNISVDVTSSTDYEHVYECLDGLDQESSWIKEGNLVTVENGSTDLEGYIFENTLIVTLRDTFEIEMFDGTNYFYQEEDIVLEYTKVQE